MLLKLFCINFLCAIPLFAQKCETYNRALFKMLPSDFPDEINCLDQNGVKQGWWINYKIEYNDVPILDVQPKGYFIREYSCGKYKDGKRVGDWKTINNVHAIFIANCKNYYYSEDTTIIKTCSSPFLSEEVMETLYFNSSLSIFIKTIGTQAPITIEVNKNKVGSELFIYKVGDKLKFLPINLLNAAINHPNIKQVDGNLIFDPDE